MSDHQPHWSDIFEASGYLLSALVVISGIDEGSFRKYLKCDRIPRKTNRAKMEAVMKLAAGVQRLEYNPSFGYATKEQVLSSLRLSAWGLIVISC